MNIVQKLQQEKSLLQQAGLIVEKSNKIEELTGGYFNVFSILGMERLEVKTHSALIHELLNPKGSHFQGITYLKIFINEILEIEDYNFKNVKVDRERYISNYGRLDLVIENDENIIIIEIKIDACNQENQIYRYNQYGLKNGKKLRLYYLTLFGCDASEYSTGNSDIDYKCISFESDILSWINKCIRAGVTPVLPGIRETLVQYSKLLEKITNQLNEGVEMEIKDLLLKENNLNIAQEIAKAIPYCRAELEYRFWKGLYNIYNEKLEELGFDYVDDDFFKDEKSDIEEIVEIRKKKNGDLFFEYKVYECEKNNLYFGIGCSSYDEHIYVCLPIGNEAEYILITKYRKKILNMFEKLGFDNTSDVNKYTYVKYDLNFHTDSLLRLQDENNLNIAIKSVGDEILEIAKNIINSEELKSIMDVK